MSFISIMSRSRSMVEGLASLLSESDSSFEEEVTFTHAQSTSRASSRVNQSASRANQSASRASPKADQSASRVNQSTSMGNQSASRVNQSTSRANQSASRVNQSASRVDQSAPMAGANQGRREPTLASVSEDTEESPPPHKKTKSEVHHQHFCI